MGAWGTYALEDFLLFSPRVYFRLIALHNTEMWPLHVLGGMLGLTMLWACIGRGEAATRFSLYGLGLAWIWIGWSFFQHRYATINWTAPHVAWAFGLQGLLLAVFAFAWKPGPHVQEDGPGAARGPIALVVLGVVLWPFVGLLHRHSVAAAESIGIMPDPSVVATIGFVILIGRRYRLPLLAFPTMWLLVSLLTHLAMGSPEAWLLLGCGLLAVAAAYAARRTRA